MSGSLHRAPFLIVLGIRIQHVFLGLDADIQFISSLVLDSKVSIPSNSLLFSEGLLL